MLVRKNVLWVLLAWTIISSLSGCVPPVLAPAPMLSPLNLSDPTTVVLTDTAKTKTEALPTRSATPAKNAPEPGKGFVSGVLERFDGTPLKGIILYGALIEVRGEMRLASVDPLVDPRSVTDAEGRFSFGNLSPGEYALATQSPVGIIMPHNKSGQIVRFKVEPNGETDLGRLPVGYIYPDNN